MNIRSSKHYTKYNSSTHDITRTSDSTYTYNGSDGWCGASGDLHKMSFPNNEYGIQYGFYTDCYVRGTYIVKGGKDDVWEVRIHHGSNSGTGSIFMDINDTSISDEDKSNHIGIAYNNDTLQFRPYSGDYGSYNGYQIHFDLLLTDPGGQPP
jgi:hypothetical protein